MWSTSCHAQREALPTSRTWPLRARAAICTNRIALPPRTRWTAIPGRCFIRGSTRGGSILPGRARVWWASLRWAGRRWKRSDSITPDAFAFAKPKRASDYSHRTTDEMKDELSEAICEKRARIISAGAELKIRAIHPTRRRLSCVRCSLNARYVPTSSRRLHNCSILLRLSSTWFSSSPTRSPLRSI